jgi:hypothetical protein
MKRVRYDEDSIVNEYYANFHQAGLTLLVAAGLLVVWIAAIVVGAWVPSPPVIALSGLARAVFGWLGVTVLEISLLQYLYAFIYLRLVPNR